MKKMLIAVTLMLASGSLMAHTALMSCFDNGDGSVTCEGGFSDGSSAKGVNFRVMQNGKAIVQGKMDADSEFTFKKPKGAYEAVFDAGEGHRVTIKSSDIAK